MRKDIFDRVVAFKENVGVEGFSSEQKRLLEKLILHGRRNGKKILGRRMIHSFYIFSDFLYSHNFFQSHILFPHFLVLSTSHFLFFTTLSCCLSDEVMRREVVEKFTDSSALRSPFVKRNSGPGEEHQEAHVGTEYQVPAQLERGQHQALLHP